MYWGLIGCGVIGERRVQALPQGVKLFSCFDPNQERAQKIVQLTGCSLAKSEDEILNSAQIQGVIVATINSALVPILKKACQRGLPILIEKPAARNFAELSEVNSILTAFSSAQGRPPLIKVGFNHRFHPAFFDLKKEILNNPDDPIMFIRAQYGNGARVGFDKEWRSKAELAGGGELLDQGVHVIDLASVLMPDLKVVAGYSRTHFWNMPVDDNSWGILTNSKGSTFTFHVSSTEWKNEFRFEVYTRKRKYQWLGLGRSYGPERLITYKMTPEMGPPEMSEKIYPPEDNSWLFENTHFFDAISGKTDINGGYKDALNSLKLVEDIYKSSMKLQKEIQHSCPQTHPQTHPQWWQMS